jgi:hypothetical protein
MEWEVSYVVDQFHGGEMDSCEIIESPTLATAVEKFFNEYEGGGRLVFFQVELKEGE